MKKQLLLCLVLALPNFAFARTFLIDKIQEDKLYSESCRAELSLLTSDSFESIELQKYKRPIKEFPLFLGHFYHYSRTGLTQYSNDEILSHTISIDRNIVGGGLYLSANPITSKTYGNILTKFKVNPEASFIDTLNPSVLTIVENFVKKNFSQHPCPEKVLKTIFYQSNDIDLIQFDMNRVNTLDWFALLNDEVIQDRTEHIFSSSDITTPVYVWSSGPNGPIKDTIYILSAKAVFDIEPDFVKHYLDYYSNHEELDIGWLLSRFDWGRLSYEDRKSLISSLPFNPRLEKAVMYELNN
ncbi:MAG: hypothetical protein AB7I27_00155 [Bacteriovoracaceae bacterium]